LYKIHGLAILIDKIIFSSLKSHGRLILQTLLICLITRWCIYILLKTNSALCTKGKS